MLNYIKFVLLSNPEDVRLQVEDLTCTQICEVRYLREIRMALAKPIPKEMAKSLQASHT